MQPRAPSPPHLGPFHQLQQQRNAFTASRGGPGLGPRAVPGDGAEGCSAMLCDPHSIHSIGSSAAPPLLSCRAAGCVGWVSIRAQWGRCSGSFAGAANTFTPLELDPRVL